MLLSFVTLDVFTSNIYKGNPLAVIHVPASVSLTQTQKQLIAREFNLSESVFLHEPRASDREKGDVRIDIFTAIAEVPFAGHPTVGTSNYLLRYLKDDKRFGNFQALQTKAGRIPVQISSTGSAVQLEVAHNVHIHASPFAGQPFSHYPVVSIVKGMTFILALMPDLDELAKPSHNLLGTENTYKVKDMLDDGWREGLVTSYFYADRGTDGDGVRQLRTRSLGSREDPATGSAASALCSYLTLTEEGALERQYRITQGVEMGRESKIDVQIILHKDGKTIESVKLAGTAVLVMEGKLIIPPESDN